MTKESKFTKIPLVGSKDQIKESPLGKRRDWMNLKRSIVGYG
jgi:hypothetical protein